MLALQLLVKRYDTMRLSPVSVSYRTPDLMRESSASEGKPWPLAADNARTDRQKLLFYTIQIIHLKQRFPCHMGWQPTI